MAPDSASRVRVDFNVPATMRDGTILRANVYRPDDGGAGAYPVLLTRLPYGKDLPMGSSVLDPAQAARRGYIVVVQDVRGTFASDGAWFPFQHERSDGADTIAWAAQLPGANGTVGTFGASYFGFTQWAAATQSPAALRAMAPMIAWDDPDDGVVRRNGVIELGTSGYWNMMQGLGQLARRHAGDPRALGASFYQLAQEFDRLPTSGYAELPLNRFGPLARLGLDEPQGVLTERGKDGGRAELMRVAPAYTLDVPVLHIGGWYDIFLNGTIRNFQAMRQHGNTRQHLLIGPWIHGDVRHVVGEADFGLAASGTLVNLRGDLMSIQLQFFDRWLKGAPNGFDQTPAVQYFVMGANSWNSSDTWPPAGAREERWYLHSQGEANSLAGNGVLAREQPASEPADTYVYDPARPVPTLGGATLLHPVFRAGARDQRLVETRQDVLVYTSTPLSVPMEVTGPVSVSLYVATDAPDTDFVARLSDVHPDGTALPLTDGITRMMYRGGVGGTPEPLVSGQIYPIDVDLWSTSAVFLPGHAIRLDVTSSSFPRWERNLNTGADSGKSVEMRAARQTVLHDAEHPSCLTLSVVPA
jgi:putative CocE/NonD family hydrolase